jgi:hypothetical protein
METPLFLTNDPERLDIASKVAEVLDSIFEKCDYGIPKMVKSKNFLDAFPLDYRNILAEEVDGSIWLLKLQPKDSTDNMVYPSWIASKMGDAQKSFGLVIGFKIGKHYMKGKTQFTPLQNELRFIAIGDNGNLVLQYLIEQNIVYKREMFDEDGYLKNK